MLAHLISSFERQLPITNELDGFKFLKSQRAFQRQLADQTWSIHFAYAKYDTYFDLTCDVAIRFHTVEKQLNLNRQSLSEKEKGQTYTIGAQLYNLEKNGEHRWCIRNEPDITTTLPKLKSSIQGVAIPFFQRFTDLRNTVTCLREAELGNLICPINRGEVIEAIEEIIDLN